jgi:hypothetical protein
MGTIADMIVHCGRRARAHAERLLADVTPAQFARLPRQDGRLINTNHAAFIYGHLALYPANVLTMLGCDAAKAVAPDGWPALFGMGTTCRDDADGTIYPAMDAIVPVFLNNYTVALDAVAQVDDAVFARPTPDERFRSFLPTLGTVALSMLNNHVSLHMGQMSAWRRCMGLGSVS